jgi:hypothetical protein
MSANESNLSDAKFGYDLVVAVTQASINATMKQFLAGLAAPEVVSCYVYDANNNLVPVNYEDLKKQAHGSDPFQVPDHADPATNKDLLNLAAANYAGGFRAQIGLPDLPLASLPAIVTLSSGTDAPVLFNLLCSEFQITGFEYGPRGRVIWIDEKQPSGSGDPWYFSSHVTLNTARLDPGKPLSQTTPAVEHRIQQLKQTIGADAFSVQRLFLDLDTAILQSTPTIVGIPEGWAVWELISSIFLGAYMNQMRSNGTPVLGYSITVSRPDSSTLQVAALSYETAALLDHSKPIMNPTPAQQAAATFNYLGTSGSTPPTAALFPWNWVEVGEVSSFSGVQSVRRDVFMLFFGRLLNFDVLPLFQATTVSLSHDGDCYHIRYSSGFASNPGGFAPVNPGAPGKDGFTQVLDLNFYHPSYDSSEAADHGSSIHGNFNYTLTGSVDVNHNLIRVVIRAQAYMSFNHHELGQEYDDLPGANYYDKTQTVMFQLGVTSDGVLQVSRESHIDTNSAPWNFHVGGFVGLFKTEDHILDGLHNVENNLADLVDDNFASYGGRIADEINSHRGWVFPGARSFLFKDVWFSSHQDLVAHLTYAAI